MPPPVGQGHEFNRADSQGNCTIYYDAQGCYQMRCGGSPAWRNNNPCGVPCVDPPPTIPVPGGQIGCVDGMGVYANFDDGEAACVGQPNLPFTPGSTSELICPGHSGSINFDPPL